MIAYACLVAIIATTATLTQGLFRHTLKPKGTASVRRCDGVNMELHGNSPEFVTFYEELSVATNRGVSLVDITQDIRNILSKSGCLEGLVTVLSRHSTVSVTINEMEGRLVDDTRQFLLNLAPPSYPYLHNDLDYRKGPPDWPGGDEAWRAFRLKEPPNAHSHLIAMLLGTSESIPVHQGVLKIGTYQNIIVVDADGPKKRTIVVQVMGTK